MPVAGFVELVLVYAKLGSPLTHTKINKKTAVWDYGLFVMPVAGVEPARYRYQRILSPPRLPIPTHRLV